MAASVLVVLAGLAGAPDAPLGGPGSLIVGGCAMGQADLPVDPPWGFAFGLRFGWSIAPRTAIVLESDVCISGNPVLLTAAPGVRHWLTPRFWVLGGVGGNLLRVDPEPHPIYNTKPAALEWRAGVALDLAGGWQFRCSTHACDVELHVAPGWEGTSILLAFALEE